LRRQSLDVALDPNLPPERVPVEEERGPRVLREVAALAALVPAVEDESPLVEALEQHHPHRRTPLPRRRRERHRLRRAHACRGGLLEPGVELSERIRVDAGFGELGHYTRVSCRYGSRVDTPTPTRRSAPGRSVSARSRSLQARAPISSPSSV